jgi:hypothetical protein
MLKTRQPNKSYYSQTEVKPAQDNLNMRKARLSGFESERPIQLTTTDKPFFLRQLQNVNADKGAKVLMQCMLKPSPDTNVQWFRNNMPIKQSTDYKMDFDEKSGLATLSVSEAYPEDGGQYTCVARNPFGEESSTGWLVIKGKRL